MQPRPRHLPAARRVASLGVTAALVIGGVAATTIDTATAQPAAPAGARTPSAAERVVPTPVSLTELSGAPFTLQPVTTIHVDPAAAQGAWAVGTDLARLLRPATGYRIRVVRSRGTGAHDEIDLNAGGPRRLGSEGYQLTVRRHAVTVTARSAAGFFHGVQTLRQLLPAQIESPMRQHVEWTAPAVRITDYPRFPIRAAMLDVSRHFFTVAEVKKYIDDLAPYKLNTLELHLSDDQGWRLFIKGWPRLATYGGALEVGGTPGGYYTQQQYTGIVRYAAAHFMTVVPEFDFPSHSNAALASYAKLNCDGKAPPRYTGTDVGFSSVCVPKAITYRFLDDVVRQVAALTPGPYLSLGGDEAHSTSQADYDTFMKKAVAIVGKYGKKLWGWHQTAAADVPRGSVAAYWGTAGSAADEALAREAVAKGERLVMAPADHAYLDMQYAPDFPYGLHWAGYVSVTDSYAWDPGTLVPGVSAADVSGVLAPIWSETLKNIDEVELMAFPRVVGIAEIGWSPRSTHDFQAYRVRLAAQAERWTLGGVNFYRAPDVPWDRFG